MTPATHSDSPFDELVADVKAIKECLMGEMRPGGSAGLKQRVEALESVGMLVRHVVLAVVTSVATTFVALLITHTIGGK